MVLERLVPFKKLKDSYLLIFLFAYLFVSIAVILTARFYPQGAGLFIVCLTVLPSIPFFYKLASEEEITYEQHANARERIHTYEHVLKVYFVFFLSVILSFAFWASVLPQEVSTSLFSYQRTEFQRLSSITSNASAVIMSKELVINTIFTNNVQVLLLMLFFSFIYSIGAIFLLVWNASIIGILLEAPIRYYALKFAYLGLLAFPAGFFIGLLSGAKRTIFHGSLEFLAFFLASIGGGVSSIAVERQFYKSPIFKTMLKDIALLILLSVVLLLLGAVVEASILGV
ncbi:MAG: hypothetical protein ABIH99_05460 [Candidatus Micrarchaeota archaeon]